MRLIMSNPNVITKRNINNIGIKKKMAYKNSTSILSQVKLLKYCLDFKNVCISKNIILKFLLQKNI